MRRLDLKDLRFQKLLVIGLDNHQAICYECHKTKTKKDNSGKRNKKA